MATATAPAGSTSVPVPDKPRLRGWLHVGAFPLVLAAGVVLVALAAGPRARIAAAVYATTAALLFGFSALYHRLTWGPVAAGVLRRVDHANIFLIIAGTYTPFALLVLHGRVGTAVLWVVWVGAALGILFRAVWLQAPRWLYVPFYVGLGWTAAFVLPQLVRGGGVTVTVLLFVGGLLYTAGGVVYALKRPNPVPGWFGFHEVFHACTLGGFAAQCVAVFLVVV